MSGCQTADLERDDASHDAFTAVSVSDGSADNLEQTVQSFLINFI